MSKNPIGVELIKLVAKGLGDLSSKAVFVGAATLPLYLPAEMAAAVRPTELPRS